MALCKFQFTIFTITTLPLKRYALPAFVSMEDHSPPTQKYTTAGLLLEFVDKKVSLTQRDGATLVGILRSFDQFGSFVLQDAVEKIYCDNLYGEKHVGVLLVRGDIVAMLGEFDLDKEAEVEQVLQNTYKRVSYEEVYERREKAREALNNKRKEEAANGFRIGLDASVNTANPYYF